MVVADVRAWVTSVLTVCIDLLFQFKVQSISETVLRSGAIIMHSIQNLPHMQCLTALPLKLSGA